MKGLIEWNISQMQLKTHFKHFVIIYIQLNKRYCLRQKQLHFSLSFFMMNNLHFIFIFSTFILIAGHQMNGTDLNTAKIKDTHPMSTAWSCLPVFGFCGTLLNSFVLYIGYSERQTFIKPVNAMIWSVNHFKNSYTTL